MADDKSKRGKADRTKIAGGEAYEVRYAAKKTGVTPAAIKAAIKDVGNSRTKVNIAVKKLPSTKKLDK